MLLLIDNYDSFVFNLARYFRELGMETRVVRNDAISIADVAGLSPEAVVLSPGPCTPREAGISMDLVRHFVGKIPMLGVCLGHQAIAAALGAEVIRAAEPVHGRTSPITHDESALFAGIDNPFLATRYHSLIVDKSTIPSDLKITARLPDGRPMALQHRDHPLFGVQFHPESILTECGKQVLANFLQVIGLGNRSGIAGNVPERRHSAATDEIVLPSPLHW